jgi:hypothetical protein
MYESFWQNKSQSLLLFLGMSASVEAGGEYPYCRMQFQNVEYCYSRRNQSKATAIAGAATEAATAGEKGRGTAGGGA